MSPDEKYNWFLKKVAIPKVSNRTTTDRQLQKAGKDFFGDKFHGVYMRDEIPSTFNQTRPYGIINLGTRASGGTHWIAVAAQKNGRRFMVYDSFGKLHKTPNELKQKYGLKKGKGIQNTDDDREQGLKETNCGARCLAWLLMAECFPNEAARI